MVDGLLRRWKVYASLLFLLAAVFSVHYNSLLDTGDPGADAAYWPAAASALAFAGLLVLVAAAKVMRRLTRA